MVGLVLKLTDAGLAAVQAAAGSDPVVIAQLGLTITPFDYAPTLTGLPGEFKRIGAVSGVAAAANIAHLTAYDTSADTWTATGLGLYLDDGTLFAVHASDEPVQSKASLAFALISIDIIFNSDLAADIAFGNAIFTNPPATEEMRGLIELATLAEARAAVDRLRALTPGIAAVAVLDWLRNHNLHLGQVDLEWLGHKVWTAGNDGSGSGLDAGSLAGQLPSHYTDIPARLGFTPVRQGGGPGQLTNTVKFGWSGTRLKAAVDDTDQGNVVMDMHIADVWRASNDGSGSGLDADLLAGQLASYYTDIVARLGFRPVRQGGGPGQLTDTVDVGWSGTRLKASVNGFDLGDFIMAEHIWDVWRASNDGSGSGLDADMLDGQHASYFTDILARLGFTPVKQGGGPGQLNNPINLGWSGTRLKASVDGFDLGEFIMAEHIWDVWRASNDGSGSGLDADLLDGKHASHFEDIPARLGFTPMEANKYDDFLRSVAGSLTENGYVRLSNGLMFCWGRFTAAANGYTAVTFPMSFPTACFGVSVNGTDDYSAGAQDNWPNVSRSTITKNGFSAVNANDASDGCNYFAWGY